MIVLTFLCFLLSHDGARAICSRQYGVIKDTDNGIQDLPVNDKICVWTDLGQIAKAQGIVDVSAES